MLSIVAIMLSVLALFAVYALAQGMGDLRRRIGLLEESARTPLPGEQRTWRVIVKSTTPGMKRTIFHIQADTESDALKTIMAPPYGYKPQHIIALDRDGSV